MSKKALESAIGKSILDQEFRQFLFALPDEALSHFRLTHAEKNAIKRLDSETLEFLAKTLSACPGWNSQIIRISSLKQASNGRVYKTKNQKENRQ